MNCGDKTLKKHLRYSADGDPSKPGLAFVHGPDFDDPDFDGVKVRVMDRVGVRVWVKFRVWLGWVLTIRVLTVRSLTVISMDR